MQTNAFKLETIDIFKLKKDDYNLNCNVDSLLTKLNSEDDFSISELLNLTDDEFNLIYNVISHYSNIFVNNVDTKQYLDNITNKKDKFILQKSISISAANALSRDLDSIKTTTHTNSLDFLY